MNSSETKDLVAALIKARAEFPAIEKNRTAGGGGKFSYRYSDLEEVISKTTPILLKHGLCITQSITPNYGSPAGGDALSTTLWHVSGQSISGSQSIPANDNPQEKGKTITYYRRYGQCAILNIVGEDDDDAQGIGGKSAEKTATATGSQPGTDSKEKMAPKTLVNDLGQCPVCGKGLLPGKEAGWKPWCKDKYDEKHKAHEAAKKSRGNR